MSIIREEFKLNIVLVEPQIPQNTGNIARTCASTGASLHLIKPMAFSISDKSLRRAGLDYWHLLDIHIHESLEAFLENVDGNFFFFTTKGENIYSDISYPNNPYLFFGKETAGLPETLLKTAPQRCVRLPMLHNDAARSLNLSNAVAIGTYEVLRQWHFPELKTKGVFPK